MINTHLLTLTQVTFSVSFFFSSNSSITFLIFALSFYTKQTQHAEVYKIEAQQTINWDSKTIFMCLLMIYLNYVLLSHQHIVLILCFLKHRHNFLVNSLLKASKENVKGKNEEN